MKNVGRAFPSDFFALYSTFNLQPSTLNPKQRDALFDNRTWYLRVKLGKGSYRYGS